VTAGAPSTGAETEDKDLDYERDERLAIQNEPPLSPETREANRAMGDFPSDFDRRPSRIAKNGR